MCLIKNLSLILILTLVSSCSTFFDVGNVIFGDSSKGTLEVQEAKDAMTGEVKYTSPRLDDVYNSHKPVITAAGNNQYKITGAIKFDVFLTKSKNTLSYFLQLSVTESKGLDTSELMFKCGDKEYISHKITDEEKQARSIMEQSLEVTTNTKFFYQEEFIQTKISPDEFNYLANCSSDLLMRAKGVRGSTDSSLQAYSTESQAVHLGLGELKNKIITLQSK